MDSNLVKIVILGIIQGITEFLPISSSGHLVLFQGVMDMDQRQQVLISVVLHGGSLGSIICYYYKDLLRLIKATERKSVWLIAAGTLPLVVLGIPLKKLMDLAEQHPGILGWFSVGGFLVSFFLLTFVYKRSEEINDIKEISYRQAFFIGLMQLVAVTPGISRSGSTISVAGRMGISPDTGARFSFFLGIIAIFGACASKAKDVVALFDNGASGESMSFFHLSVGFVVSFVVGYVALSFLIKVLQKGKLNYFGYYCLLMAVVTTIFAIAKH